MIAKAFDDSCPPSDAMNKAGWEAEKQMAFYLHRMFGPRPDVAVINGLRCKVHGASAVSEQDHFQIDHLVIHNGGFVIVESKSVSTEVRVLGDGQWIRTWKGKTSGMPSPLEQAAAQSLALRRLLDAHSSELLKKMLGMLQARFGNAHILTLVAISDQGKLGRPHAKAFPEAMKADQVCTRIAETVDEHRKANSLVHGAVRALLNAKPIVKKPEHDWVMGDEERQRVVSFLLSRHDPKVGAAASSAPPVPPRESRVAEVRRQIPDERRERSVKIDPLVCTKCGEEKRLEVVFRRDYCLLCAACGGYTALGRACGACGKQSKIRKDGAEFFRECAPAEGGCGARVVFWTNVGE